MYTPWDALDLTPQPLLEPPAPSFPPECMQLLQSLLYNGVGIAVSNSHQVLTVLASSNVSVETLQLLLPGALESHLVSSNAKTGEPSSRLLRQVLLPELHAPVQSRLLELQRGSRKDDVTGDTLVLRMEGGALVSVRITPLQLVPPQSSLGPAEAEEVVGQEAGSGSSGSDSRNKQARAALAGHRHTPHVSTRLYVPMLSLRSGCSC